MVREMDLRELKKEVDGLQDLRNSLGKLHLEVLKPLSELRLPFLQELHPEKRKTLHQKLYALTQTIAKIKQGQLLHEKLQQQARSLVDLKLASFSKDKNKSKHLIKQMLHDDVFSLQGTMVEIQKMEQNIQLLSQQYDSVSQVLYQGLPLEDMLSADDLLKKSNVRGLQETVQMQKKLAQHLGRHFLQLSKNFMKR